MSLLLHLIFTSLHQRMPICYNIILYKLTVFFEFPQISMIDIPTKLYIKKSSFQLVLFYQKNDASFEDVYCFSGIAMHPTPFNNNNYLRYIFIWNLWFWSVNFFSDHLPSFYLLIWLHFCLYIKEFPTGSTKLCLCLFFCFVHRAPS